MGAGCPGRKLPGSGFPTSCCVFRTREQIQCKGAAFTQDHILDIAEVLDDGILIRCGGSRWIAVVPPGCGKDRWLLWVDEGPGGRANFITKTESYDEGFPVAGVGVRAEKVVRRCDGPFVIGIGRRVQDGIADIVIPHPVGVILAAPCSRDDVQAKIARRVHRRQNG